MPPNVTITGAGPEYDNLQPLTIPDVNDEEPSVDEMQYALNAPKHPVQTQHQPAQHQPTQNFEPPAPEPEKYIMAGRGVRVKPFENIVGPSITEGLIPTLYGAASGTAAGVAGMPGGINELLREYVVPHLPQSAQNFLGNQYAPPTAEQIQQHIPSISNLANLGPQAQKTEKAANWLGQNVTSNLVAPEAAIGAVGSGVPAIARIAGERVMHGRGLIPGVPSGLIDPVILSAMKEKGGNWLTTPTDWNISRLHKFEPQWGRDANFEQRAIDTGYEPVHIEGMKADMKINDWLNSKLKKYVKNELGTPDDSLRKLADEGITHLNLEEHPEWKFTPDKHLKERRNEAGYNPEGYAKTRAGKLWENMADEAFHNTTAGEMLNHDNIDRLKVDDSWLEKVAPETNVYHPSQNNFEKLQFDHVRDELHNAIHPNSDLPQHLKLQAKDLDKMSVPDAVRQVNKINEWRAAEMAKAKTEDMKAFPILKEYPDGFRWYELKLPESKVDLPWSKEEAAKYSPEDLKTHEALYTKDHNYKLLDKALKNEGKQMGHCVGGYCDDVAAGHSRIFTLRDPKGSSHVTIEATPWYSGEYDPKRIPREVQDKIDDMAHSETVKAGYPEGTQGYYNHYTGVQIQEGSKYLKQNPYRETHLTQIKGKSNGEVITKYQPYVKDFLNSGDHLPNLKDTHDLSYANLIDTSKPANVVRFLMDNYGGDFGHINGTELYNELKAANPKIDRFIHNDELGDLVDNLPSRMDPDYRHKMKKGGRVKSKLYFANDLDTMKHELLRKK